MPWRLADAKSRLSEVIDRALAEGPQRITRRGDVVLVVSEAEYLRAIGQRPGFVDYLCAGPSLAGLDFERDASPARDVER